MSKLTQASRTERMAGLLELMQEECTRRGLLYANEMASLASIWHAASVSTDSGSVAQQLVAGGLPILINKESDPTPSEKGIHTLWGVSQAEYCRARGYEAAQEGLPRNSCPFHGSGGGFRELWLDGFDEYEQSSEPSTGNPVESS